MNPGRLILALCLLASGTATAAEDWKTRKCISNFGEREKLAAKHVVECKHVSGTLLTAREALKGYGAMPDEVTMVMNDAEKYRLLVQVNLPDDPEIFVVTDLKIENQENENAIFNFTLTPDRPVNPENNFLGRAGFGESFRTDNLDAPAHTIIVRLNRADAKLTADYSCAIPATKDFGK